MEEKGVGSVDSSKITLMKIEKNTIVTLLYRLTDAQDNLIEESGEPMIYLHGGYSGTFPKIEELLEGQEIGFETRIHLEPEDAFGDYDTTLLKVESRDRFPTPLEVGMQFEGVPSADAEGEDQTADLDDDDELEIYTVTDIAEDRVVLDANHPLAGMALRFWVQVSDIREATPEEVDHGHPHGASGLEVDGDDEDELDELEKALNLKDTNPPTLH
jgi:FKBP-type peptidyl-prolyl cis-trans isomerase SlyD